MKHFKKLLTLLMLLTVISGSRSFAQDFLSFSAKMNLLKSKEEQLKLARANEVMQDNEYTSTGYEKGQFYDNPLMLDGKPLDYGDFNLQSQGELTVSKGAAITGKTTQVPFFVYLRRNGDKVLIPGREKPDPNHFKIDVSEILNHAEQGDHLVIEAVNKEDGAVKRILKLLGAGC